MPDEEAEIVMISGEAGVALAANARQIIYRSVRLGLSEEDGEHLARHLISAESEWIIANQDNMDRDELERRLNRRWILWAFIPPDFDHRRYR